MRIPIYIILFFSATLSLRAQDADSTQLFSYIQKAMNFNKVVPQEKVYLHFDNMGYFENETMWFKAYVIKTDNGTPTNLSKVLYVELLNPSGDVIKTRKYPIDEKGEAHGDLKLDTLLGTGFYEVRAYTRYMTNWGVNAIFSRVFPVFKKPQQEGDYTDLTLQTRLYKQRDPNNRDRTDSLYLNAIEEGVYSSKLEKTISVQFYPEGGHLIAGKKCRVAMLAVDDNGLPYQDEGFVMNEAGDVLGAVETDSLGRGVFEVVPDGSDLTFQMRNLKKKTQFFPLPPTKTEGCALGFDAISDTMLATIQTTDSLCGSLMGYVVIHNGNILQYDTLKAVPLMEIEIDRSSMKEGVHQFTLFDSKGEILAERLFFLCPKINNGDSILVKTDLHSLKPCGKVEIELQTQPNASLSFSAIDAQTMTNGKQGNMKTWMLLSSDVKGYINNIDYYFEADDKEHRHAADLLMMTQGWRRYDWRLMSEKYIFRKSEPIEDKFYIYGRLKPYRKKNPANGVNVEVLLYNKDGQSLIGKSQTDAFGNYAFEMPFVDGEWNMQIYTRREGKRKTYYVGIDRQFSPTPRFITPLESHLLHPLKSNLKLQKQISSNEEEEAFIPITKKDHVLQNVTVKAKKKYFTNDNWKYKNENYGRQYATLYYNIDKELNDALDVGKPVPYLLSYLDERNALFEYYPGRRSMPLSEYVKYTGRDVAWIVDNGERRFVPRIEELWLDEVKSIYIVPGHPDNTNGNVSIYVYLHTKFTTESQKGLRRTYFQGFNSPSTFQMEDYSIVPPMADFRRTIYWNPNVQTDAEGRAHIEFFNNSTSQELYISAEGITPDGKILINE